MTMRLFYSLAFALLIAVGCGNGKTEQKEDVTVDVGGGGLGEVLEEGAAGCDMTGEVATELSASTILAGEAVMVACSLSDCPEADRADFALAIAGEAGTHYEQNGFEVTFLLPGSYELACVVDGRQDETPASLQVEPGPPASIETVLAEKEVKAGTSVVAQCSAWDHLGNPVYGQFSVATTPAIGVTVNGVTFVPTIAGEYDVVCVLDEQWEGEKPAPLEVVPNVPARILTELSSTEVQAGKSVKISCKAMDKWENKVSGFPMVVYAPPELELAGLALSGTAAGFYEVKCVPQADDWKLFVLLPQVLTILPADPALISLTVIPAKSAYKLLDKVLLQAGAKDMYGNLVPDAPLAPVEITTVDGAPTEAMVEVHPMAYKFVEEGMFKVVVKLLDSPSIFKETVLLVDGSAPTISVDFPTRGATLADKPSVTVTGTVSDDVAGLPENSFTVNGEVVKLAADGSFSHIVIAAHAVNLLTAKAVDEAEESARTVRSFAFSDVYYPVQGSDEETYVPDGLQIFLAESFIDDGDHNPEEPDDLATILEILLAGTDFAALIPNPVYNANNYKVFIKNVVLQSPAVMMDMIEGGITVGIEFSDFQADVEAIGSCSVLGIDLCPDASGALTIADISLYASMQVSLDAAGSIVCEMTEYHLGVEGLELDLSGLGSLLDPIINGIMAVFEQEVEKALANALGGMLPGIIADLFGQFELDENISMPALVEGGEPVTISLRTKFSNLLFTPSGMTMHFHARAGSTPKVLHSPLGSIGRGSCAGPDEPPYELDTSGEASVGIFDDLLNQLLFAVWWGGALNLTLTEDTLGSAADTLAGYGIKEPAIKLDFFLAPMLSDCNGDKSLRFGLGDLYVQANFKMVGQPISLGLFVTAYGSAAIALTEEAGSSSFELTVESIDVFDYEIVSVTEGFEELVPIINELLAGELLEGALAEIAGQSFGGLELPVLDLTGIVPGVPPGTKLSIYPTSLERRFGYTEMTGVFD